MITTGNPYDDAYGILYLAKKILIVVTGQDEWAKGIKGMGLLLPADIERKLCTRLTGYDTRGWAMTCGENRLYRILAVPLRSLEDVNLDIVAITGLSCHVRRSVCCCAQLQTGSAKTMNKMYARGILYCILVN